MKMRLNEMTVPQKWIFESVSSRWRPNIFGNQKVKPAKKPITAMGKNV